MKRYRMRPTTVDAIQFDGTSAGVERVLAWIRQVAPGRPARPRTEYAGWTDTTGHLEIEVRGMEHGAMAGDWLLVTVADDQKTVWFVDEATFAAYYEEVER